VVKVRDGQVANRPFYAAIGVTLAGERDWGVLKILDRASRLRGSVHARASPEVQPAV
jgi:hypothetical protein